jgi:hypothetical protein
VVKDVIPGLVIVACGAKKTGRPGPAADLYTGAYFRACLRYGFTLVESDGVRSGRWRRVRILSAKHGLVLLDTWLQPYNLTLATSRKAFPGEVLPATVARRARGQAQRAGLLTPGRVVILGGARYVRLVREIWPDAEAPLAGVGGIGKQLQWLKKASAK